MLSSHTPNFLDRTHLFQKGRRVNKRIGCEQSTTICLSSLPKPLINVILSVGLSSSITATCQVLLSPVPGQQFVIEVPLPRNIDTQKRVRTRQAKPRSDEALIICGSNLSIYTVGQESYVNFQDGNKNMFTWVHDVATKCSLLLWRGEEAAFPSLNI